MGSSSKVCTAIEAEAYESIARGYQLLAQAAKLHASQQKESGGPSPDWIPAADSPLGRRKTLALARTGDLESTKIGRKVLVHRASLDALLAQGRRAAKNDIAEEDLFAA